MKRVIVIFAFALSLKGINIYSQNDSLFTSVGVTYTIEYDEVNPPPPGWCTGWIDHYYVKENLYYNDTLYQKIDKTSQSINDCYTSSLLDTGCTSPYGYICYINKKLYFKDSLTQFQHVLVYDFNLNVGDTFYFLCTYSQVGSTIDTLTVTHVDSIMLGGINRKRIDFSYPQVLEDSITWVEGIGDIHHGFLMFNYGPFICEYYPDWPPHPDYSCVRTPTEYILGGGDVYVNCHAGIKDNMSEDFKINNPATDKFILSLPENFGHTTYTLYDMQGTPQLTGKTGNTQTELNVATLPRGLYVLKVITNKQSLAKKVVLQ